MGGFAFPVYVRLKDCGDVLEFPTQAVMQGYLEAIDVENDEYEAWDAQGRYLGLAVQEVKSQWLKITPVNGSLSAAAFEEIKAKAERKEESEPLVNRFRRWIESKVKGPNAKG